MTSKEPTRPAFAGQAIVIPGEAPETDDETEPELGYGEKVASTSANLPAKSKTVPSFRKDPPNLTQKPKRDSSLLHQKLRDAQINLAIDTADFTGRTTNQMNMEMQRVAQGVRACQLTLQDAMCHVRSVAEDLYKIDDNLDAIFDSNDIIPDTTSFDSFPTVTKYSKCSK